MLRSVRSAGRSLASVRSSPSVRSTSRSTLGSQSTAGSLDPGAAPLPLPLGSSSTLTASGRGLFTVRSMKAPDGTLAADRPLGAPF